ncbi:hypothetical protein SMQE13_08720 [Serratia marcescens]|nr:hypothetical protein SMQE13_08720 [Serratia marcescens]
MNIGMIIGVVLIYGVWSTASHAFVTVIAHPAFQSSVDGQHRHNYRYIYTIDLNLYPDDPTTKTCPGDVTTLSVIHQRPDGGLHGHRRDLPSGYSAAGKNLGEIARDNPNLFAGGNYSASVVAAGDSTHQTQFYIRMYAGSVQCGSGRVRPSVDLTFPQPPQTCNFDVDNLVFDHGPMLITANGGTSSVEKSLRISCNLHVDVRVTSGIQSELPEGQYVYFSFDGVKDANTYLVQYDRTLAVRSTVEWDGDPWGAGPLGVSGVITLDIL